jgi:hypothetical protein
VFAGWQLVELLRTGIPLVMLQFQYQQLNILLNTHSLLQLISRNIQLFSQTTISMLQVGHSLQVVVGDENVWSLQMKAELTHAVSVNSQCN